MNPASTAFMCGICACLTLGNEALAATVYVNSPAVVAGPAVPVAVARLRASPENWDMSLSEGGGNNQQNLIQAELASAFNPPGRTFDFVLENRPGEGLLFRAATGANPPVILAWGNFSPGIPHAKLVSMSHSPPAPNNYNLLNLQAQADRPSSSVTFANLLFSSPTLDIQGGALQSGTVNSGDSAGSTQYLIADTNIGAHAWTLSGSITLRRPGQGGGDSDFVGFVITAGLSPITSGVPEPRTGLFLFPALTFLALRIRNLQPT